MRFFILFLVAIPVFALNLQVVERPIEVNGKKGTVYSIVGPDGSSGLFLKKGESFDVRLENRLKVPTSIHWHGLILPNDQDGAANVTQYPIYPGESYHYQFPLVQSGTFWMHSHFYLELQRLLSAPLILLDDEEKMGRDVVVLLTDFSFQSPELILAQLRKGMKMSSMKKSDLVDVNYDAFLANGRTVNDPEVVKVHAGEKVRLRIINGASSTNFFLFLNGLQGEAIAVDGNRIAPLTGSQFELADAQRIDLVVTIPEKGGVFPILAQGEGTDMQTGIVLMTEGATLPRLSSKTKTAGALTNALEGKYHPLAPLPSRSVDQRIEVELGGDMENYIWTMNGQAWPEITPLIVEEGARVEIVFKNTSTMAHPMHLHGHVFQVTAMNGKAMQGAMRDTVLVLPQTTLAIQFDANNPGVWPFHCHLLYHQEAGMMTIIRYKQFLQPL